MESKGIFVLFLCALSISVCYSHNNKVLDEKLAKSLQTLYYDFFSSSLLWQSLAHYFNRSELVLPGYSQVFREFSKLDQQHAYRAMELTGMRGFKFIKRKINTKDIITTAVDEKSKILQLEEVKKDKNRSQREKRKTKKEYDRIVRKFPGCSKVNITMADLKDEIEPYFLGKQTTDERGMPRALSILKFAQLIENCCMAINMKQFEKDAHLNYVIQREFVTEQINRGKALADMVRKLYGGHRWVEFVNDKILMGAALQF